MSQASSQDVPASNPTPGPNPTPAIFGDPKAIQEAKDLIQRTFGHLLIPADPHALLGDICSNCLRPRPDKRKDYCSAHCARDAFERSNMPPPTCTLCDTGVNPGEGNLCSMHEKSASNGDPNGPPTSG